MNERKSLWGLNSEARDILFRTLLEIDHQSPDYSDVRVGDIITAQRIANAEWAWEPFKWNTHETIELLDCFCEFGVLIKAEGVGQYKITEYGLETIKDCL